MVADRAKELNIPYAFGKDAYTGYNTQATQADIINAANAEVKAREAINALEGALTKTQRPQYGQVQFAQQAPAGIGALKPFQTFADRALLGGTAPGAAVVPGMAAPTPYEGVPATPARPAINLSPQYQGAQDVAGLIAAAQNYVAPRSFMLPTNVPSGIVPYNPPTPGTTVRVPETPPNTNTTTNNLTPSGFEREREGGYIKLADGGIASLAQKVQDAGRGDDTMLVHMTPNEVAGLQALAMNMGGSGTINPYTGLPEFGWLDKAFKKIIKPVAKVAQYVIPFIPGIGLPMAALLSGVAGGFAGGKGGKTFDFKRALVSGITSYGLGSLARSAAAAGDAAKTAAVDPLADVYSGGSDIFGATSAPATPPANAPFDQIGDIYAGGGSQFYTPTPAELPPITAAPPAAPTATVSRGFISDLPEGSSFTDYAKATGQNIKESITGAPKLLSGDKSIQAAAQDAGAINPITGKPIAPVTAGTVALTGAAMTEGMDRAATAAAIKEDEDERMRRLAYDIMERYPIQYAEGGPVTDELGYDMATGGLKEGSFVVPADVVAHLGNGSSDAGLKMLAKKYGATPIKGDGDGMSDSIPTTIGGKQPARVADGEAVIPAEVVKKVGPNKLYRMMDQVRKARTGTTKQGKEINPTRYMPA
jgi:hypothetical protein